MFRPSRYGLVLTHCARRRMLGNRTRRRDGGANVPPHCERIDMLRPTRHGLLLKHAARRGMLGGAACSIDGRSNMIIARCKRIADGKQWRNVLNRAVFNQTNELIGHKPELIGHVGSQRCCRSPKYCNWHKASPIFKVISLAIVLPPLLIEKTFFSCIGDY